VIDNPGVCLSHILTCLCCAKTAQRIEILFGVDTGPKEQPPTFSHLQGGGVEENFSHCTHDSVLKHDADLLYWFTCADPLASIQSVASHSLLAQRFTDVPDMV